MPSETCEDFESAQPGKYFLCQYDVVQNFVRGLQERYLLCSCPMRCVKTRYTAFICSFYYQCQSKHTISWSSSDKVGNYHKVNLRSVMACTCSGMLNIQFKKIAKFLGLGSWNKRLKATVSFPLRDTIGAKHDESILSALYVEVERTGEQVSYNCRGIRIMSVARHVCRKNSHHTDVVAIGQRTRKVVNVQHVTKMNDVSTHRHEFLGTKRVYSDMNSRGIQVRINYTNTQ